MQKTKRIILFSLMDKPRDRFQLRSYFKMNKTATNPTDLIKHLDILEEKQCIDNDKGMYFINMKGRNLLFNLQAVEDILK